MSDTDKPFHVLVADDEPMLRSVIAEFLSTLANCTFAEVGDGVEALEYLRTNRVDCLLSDARMPRMDLEEMLEAVARESPETVIIATSGYSDLETACRMLDRGAHEFLAKPLNLDLLEQSLAWIPQRNQILRIAGEYFAGAERDMALNYAKPFGFLDEALEAVDAPFDEPMRHARRTGDLAEILLPEGGGADANELRLAALLHEIGCSSQHLATIALTRPLQAEELSFVRMQLAVGGRLLEHALPGRPTGEIVLRHLGWLDGDSSSEGEWDDTQRLACMLGAINVVDALMRDRADRKAYSLDQAQTTLKRLHADTGLSVIVRLLTRWSTIVDYYTSRAAR